MKGERAHRTTNTTLSLIGIAYISYRRLCVWSSSPSRVISVAKSDGDDGDGKDLFLTKWQ